jgi:hypothetical protein
MEDPTSNDMLAIITFVGWMGTDCDLEEAQGQDYYRGWYNGIRYVALAEPFVTIIDQFSNDHESSPIYGLQLVPSAKLWHITTII